MDTFDVTGVHTLPQPPLQLVQVEPALLLPLVAFAEAAAVAAAMLAAAGVMPHMSGGGLGPFLALYASPSNHMMRWMSLMKPCWGPMTEPGRQTRM
jgi:hypothetical protein